MRYTHHHSPGWWVMTHHSISRGWQVCITKVVEIKEFWIKKPLTEGNRKDVDGLEPLFITSIFFFTFDVSLSVDSNVDFKR